MASAWLAFYTGEGVDAEGRRIDEILQWDAQQLEDCHDYIQWLFPLPEASAFNARAPRLTPADIDDFHRHPSASANLRRALERMLGFYGFVWKGGELEPGPDFEVRARNWLHPNNHNHLRLTRILRSLSLLGYKAEAQALLNALLRLDHGVTPATRRFWLGALAS